MRFRLRRPSKPTVFAGLMVLAMVGVLLPERATRFKCGLVQLIAPLQYPLRATTDRVGRQMRQLADRPAGVPDYQQLLRDKQALENRTAALSDQVRELKEMNQQLTRLRQIGFQRGRLIPARVVAPDAVAWRDSLAIDKGSTRGVKPKQWVATRFFVDAGQDRRIRQGLFVLSGESLVGRIEQAAPYTSRVVLLSDPSTNMEVSIGRLERGQFTVQDAKFLLHGQHERQIWIGEVDYRKYIETGKVREGDLVVKRADSRLPVTMMVGQIAELRPDSTNALIYHLRVVPPVDFNDLRTVYIVDPEGQ